MAWPACGKAGGGGRVRRGPRRSFFDSLAWTARQAGPCGVIGDEIGPAINGEKYHGRQ